VFWTIILGGKSLCATILEIYKLLNLIAIITQAILVNGGISNLDFISKKLMFFGVKGVIVFLGLPHKCYYPTPIPICSIHD